MNDLRIAVKTRKELVIEMIREKMVV